MRIHALTRKEGSANQLHSNSNYSYFICQSQYSKRPITLRHMDPDSTRPVVIDNGSGVDLQEMMHHLQSFHLSLAVHDTKVH
ncbi:hypothetical protein T08_12929 [Trichinella sp. T8]|nr:hypothetical protein T08_12929 [Trichinella sp. T8]